MNHHTLALVSILGSSLDVLGALYLAYDLLGGEHGPLRALTRGVTYGLIFAVGYGLPLGPVFGLAAGVTHGMTLAWEYSRASRGMEEPGFWFDVAASTIRGAGHGIGLGWFLGPWAGAIFGSASAIGQVAAYRIGIRPTLDYSPAPRPRITLRQFLAVLNRSAGYGIVAAWLFSQFAHKPGLALWMGLRVGLSIGIVTAVASACTPVIEWAADRVPAKRMGVAGIGLILVGFTLQSVQYWAAFLDVPIR